MSQYDLMKLFSRYDSEVCEGDFTPEELEEYLAFCEGREDAPSPAEFFCYYNKKNPLCLLSGRTEVDFLIQSYFF